MNLVKKRREQEIQDIINKRGQGVLPKQKQNLTPAQKSLPDSLKVHKGHSPKEAIF